MTVDRSGLLDWEICQALSQYAKNLDHRLNYDFFGGKKVIEELCRIMHAMLS